MGFNVRNKGGFARRAAAAAAVIFLLYGTLCRLKPAYCSRAAACANAAVNEIVNSAVSEVFDGAGGKLSLRENGVLEADTAELNRLKSDIMTRIGQKIAEYDIRVVSIPVLSASRLPLLSGMGPELPVKIAPVSLLNGELTDSFETAGINQVKHGVTLKISVEVQYSGYMFSQSEAVVTDVPLIETVITGDVPKYYGINGVAVNEE